MACVEGGWWTQARLYATGVATDATCRACAKMKGTLWHRVGRCEAGEQLRAEESPPTMMKKAEIDKWDPLYYRAVPGMPKVTMHKPPTAHQWGPGGQPTSGALATGDVFSDGSLDGVLWGATRGGWGIAVVNQSGKVEWSLGGTCQDWHPTVLRAELRGVLEALRRAAPPIRLHVDCQAVIDGVAQGREYCTSAKREGADLWRRIWPLIEDIGLSPGALTFVKVKAHCTLADVREGRLTLMEWAGNAAADKAAKRGCQLARQLCPNSAPHAALRRAVAWYKWMATLTLQWPADTEWSQGEVGARAGREEGKKSRRKSGFLPHLIWRLGSGDLLCRRCGREAAKSNAAKAKVMWASRCHGTAAGRLLQHMAQAGTPAARHCMYSIPSLLMRGARPTEEEVGNLSDLEESSSEEERKEEAERGGLEGRSEDQAAEAGEEEEETKGWEEEEVETTVPRRESRHVPRMLGSSTDIVSDQAPLDVRHSTTLEVAPKGTDGPEKRKRADEKTEAKDKGAPTGAEELSDHREAMDVATRVKAVWKRHRALTTAGVGGWQTRGMTTLALKRVRKEAAVEDSPVTKLRRADAPIAGTPTLPTEDARGVKRSPEPPAAASTTPSMVRRRLVGKQTIHRERQMEETETQTEAHQDVEAIETGPAQTSQPPRRPDGGEEKSTHPSSQLEQHQLRLTGPVAWCARCGRHAIQRVRGLGGACTGKPSGVYAVRLKRLLEGRRPISGKLLDAMQ